MPNGLLWRLSFVNLLVITGVMGASSWAVYRTACFLAGGIGSFETLKQQQFNSTFFQYILIFGLIGLVAGSLIHFYLIKKLLKPINNLIDSIKLLQNGAFPEPIDTDSQDEVGQLVNQYNALISQLKINEEERIKLVNDISHEFRTPLSNLSGYMYALKTGHMEGNEKIYASLYKEVARLTNLLDNMDQLKEWDYLSNQGYIQKEEADMKEQINQSVSMFSVTTEQDDISLVVDAEAYTLSINSSGIQQVLSILIDNAIRYYEGEKPVYITGACRQSDYCVKITGQGKPIDPKDAEHLFERFYRVESSRNQKTGGSGLGLSIAKEIIEKHGGTIGLSIEQNENSFWFTIPSSV